MRSAWIIAKRELAAIFVQPIAYVFAIAIVGITGLIFSAQISLYVQQPGAGVPVTVEQPLGLFNFLLVFLVPAVTMRLLSEEQRGGTMELLMTLPVRDGEVVLGKFLAAFIFHLSTVALTLIYPLILLNFGNPDVGPILTSYLGVLLWGAALLGIGIFASALSENQMVSFMVAAGIILFFYLAAIPAQYFALSPRIAEFFTQLAFEGHSSSFLSGIILVQDVVYYVMVTAIFLFAAARVLESRRWR